jgi:hypothetical protein
VSPAPESGDGLAMITAELLPFTLMRQYQKAVPDVKLLRSGRILPLLIYIDIRN